MEAHQIELSRFTYKNPITGEPMSGDRLILDGCELHCGDVVEVLLPDGWRAVRAEMGSAGWYLAGTAANPVGLFARIPEE